MKSLLNNLPFGLGHHEMFGQPGLTISALLPPAPSLLSPLSFVGFDHAHSASTSNDFYKFYCYRAPPNVGRFTNKKDYILPLGIIAAGRSNANDTPFGIGHEADDFDFWVDAQDAKMPNIDVGQNERCQVHTSVRCSSICFPSSLFAFLLLFHWTRTTSIANEPMAKFRKTPSDKTHNRFVALQSPSRTYQNIKSSTTYFLYDYFYCFWMVDYLKFDAFIE